MKGQIRFTTAEEELEHAALDFERTKERLTAMGNPRLGAAADEPWSIDEFLKVPLALLRFREEQFLDQDHGAPKPEQFGVTFEPFYASNTLRFLPPSVRRLFEKPVPLDSPQHRLHLNYLEYQKARKAFLERWYEECNRLRLQEVWWDTLTGTGFEIEVEKLLRSRGYQVEHCGGPSDGGVDLMIFDKGEYAKNPILVQCKAHGKPIGPGPIRELLGTITDSQSKLAWIVSVNGFSESARSFASGKPIKLLTVRELLKLPPSSG
jgi:Restriction endonuclease